MWASLGAGRARRPPESRLSRAARCGRHPDLTKEPADGPPAAPGGIVEPASELAGGASPPPGQRAELAIASSCLPAWVRPLASCRRSCCLVPCRPRGTSCTVDRPPHSAPWTASWPARGWLSWHASVRRPFVRALHSTEGRRRPPTLDRRLSCRVHDWKWYAMCTAAMRATPGQSPRGRSTLGSWRARREMDNRPPPCCGSAVGSSGFCCPERDRSSPPSSLTCCDVFLLGPRKSRHVSRSNHYDCPLRPRRNDWR